MSKGWELRCWAGTHMGKVLIEMAEGGAEDAAAAAAAQLPAPFAWPEVPTKPAPAADAAATQLASLADARPSFRCRWGRPIAGF